MGIRTSATFIASSVSAIVRAMTRFRYHFLLDGTMYQGAYAVEQRIQELGVRRTLGAQRHQVLGLVMRRGLLLTLVGLTLGAAAAATGAQVLRSLLFGITPWMS